MPNLHEVALEEFPQFPLRGRVREIPDVESTTLLSTEQDCLVLRGVARLVTTGSGVGTSIVARRVLDIGVCHRVGNAVNWGRHIGLWLKLKMKAFDGKGELEDGKR
jgi:hypothetical protein